ncbi:MAG: hypothetical protein AUK63_586 [bacterium P3]|nr:MAG: hypothetical protein AUK63_586 [bacterium P3]KWW42042.1 MAG: hypothetical protein F083_693 [bacterium F083]
MLRCNYPPISPDRAGFDKHDINAERAHLHTQGVAQRLDSIFGDAIPTAHEVYGLAGDGGNVDNTPRPLPPHSGQNQLAHPRQAENIHVQLTSSLDHGDIFDGAKETIAGIVDKHVNAMFRL